MDNELKRSLSDDLGDLIVTPEKKRCSRTRSPEYSPREASSTAGADVGATGGDAGAEADVPTVTTEDKTGAGDVVDSSPEPNANHSDEVPETKVLDDAVADEEAAFAPA